MQHGVFKTDVEFRKLQKTQQWARLCYVQNITSPRTMWTVRLQRKPSINARTHTLAPAELLWTVLTPADSER